MADIPLPTNQIFDFVALLARKRWTIIIPALWGLTFALVALCFIPKRYESKTVIEVREVRFEEDPLFRNTQANPYKDLQNIKTKILAETYLIRTISEQLQWSDFTAILSNPGKRKKYLDEVRDRSNVELAKKIKDQGNDYITITYKDEDPRRAADFVRVLRDLWQDDTMRSFRDQINGELFQEQRQNDDLASSLQLVLKQIKELQEEYKLSPTQASDRRTTADEDWVVAARNEANLMVVKLESELKASKERYKQALERYASEPELVEVEADKLAPNQASVGDNSLAKTLSDQITKARSEIVEFTSKQQGMTKNNYKFKDLQKKIDERNKLIKSIEAQQVKAGLATAPGDVAPKRFVLNDQKRVYKQDVDRAREDMDVRASLLTDQKARFEELEEENKKRPEIYKRYNQLETNKDIVEKQFKESTEKVERKKLILQKIDSAAGKPYRALEDPVPADTPSEPTIPLILAVGFAAGAALGLGWLLLREFVRPSFRNVHDVAESLSLPVLGMVNRMVTVSEVRRRRLRSVAGLSLSLLFVVIVGGAAGIYLVKPKMLPSNFLRMMDQVKQSFR